MDQNEEVNSINSDLIRGHIDTIILKALQAGDRYGYDIIKEIEHKSGGQYVIKQPTLYSCLKRLEVQGFVKSYWGTKSIGGRKKYFTLTDMGRELFLRNKNDWDYSRDVINRLISDEDYSASYSSEEQVVSPASGESEIINADSYIPNPEEDKETLSEDPNSDNNYEQLSLFDNPPIDNEPSLPLSITEQNQNEIDAVIEDDNTDFIDKLYNEQDQESYLTNVGNANYEPPQNNDIIDVNDYFADSETEDEFVDEETAAAVAYDEIKPESDAVILPPPEEEIKPEPPIQDDAIILPPEEEKVEPEPIHDDAIILPPNNNNDLDKQNAYQDDAIVLPPQEEITSEEPQKYESKTVFYDYNKHNVPEIDENSSIIDKEYRDVINKLISDNIINSEPQKSSVDFIDYANIDYYKDAHQKDDLKVDAPSQIENQQYEIVQQNSKPINHESYQNNEVAEAEVREKIDLRIHNTKTIKSYNNKHYYYSNQLRLLQCGILFGIMLLEIIGCFCFIEAMHNGMNITRINLALYIIAVIFAAMLPIVSFFMASTNYYKRKRINYSGKSSAIFSIAATLLLCLIIFFANVYGGILIKDINMFLSSLIMPMILSTNVIVNAIIFHLLYTSGKYNVKE